MRVFLALGWVVLLMLGVSAQAETFNVNATFFQFQTGCPPTCGTGSLTGTEVIDTTAGTVTSANLTAVYNGNTFLFSGSPSSQGADRNSAAPGDPSERANAYVSVFNNAGNALDLNLYIPLGTLVGYTGGDICGLNGTTCTPDGISFESTLNGNYVNNGTLSPAAVTVASTPEPSSLVLLATGISGAVAFWRKRLV